MAETCPPHYWEIGNVLHKIGLFRYYIGSCKKCGATKTFADTPPSEQEAAMAISVKSVEHKRPKGRPRKYIKPEELLLVKELLSSVAHKNT